MNWCLFVAANGRKMHRVINTHDEASKIGRQIAEEMLNYHRRARDSSCGTITRMHKFQ